MANSPYIFLKVGEENSRFQKEKVVRKPYEMQGGVGLFI